MSKFFRMINLFVLATAMTEPSLSIPPHLLLKNPVIHHVTVSAYTNHPSCGVGSSQKTASSRKITPKDYGKTVALSRDIGRNYRYGDGFGLWVKGKLHEVSYHDSMPKKHSRKVDLLLPSIGACRQFGRQSGLLIPLDKA